MASEKAVKWKIAFVTPRYGEGVVGGSEAVVAEAARGLAARGHDVELFTTCAKNHVTWSNALPAGTSTDRAVTIRRFKTVPVKARVLASELEHAVQAGRELSPEQERAWVNGRFRVPDLYFALASAAESFDAIVLAPYLFWSTIYGASIAPERSIVMPCLHDENYARLSVVRETLGRVGGLWFLSEPEHWLCHRLVPGLTPRHEVVGAAVEIPSTYDPAGFRRRHGITRPFVLFAGRREEGKGWRQLLAGFGSVASSLPFDLVTIGSGSAEIPDGLKANVIDLGFLEDEEVRHAFSAAEALIQPSTNESFSRVIMEAWLANTPVIASASGEVVTWHLERSGGGLSYANEAELGECLRFVAEAPKKAAVLAERGRDYVLANYTWDRVLDNMEAFLQVFVKGSAR